MSYEEVLAAIKAGAVLVDGRSPEEFAQGHLRHAVNIGLQGRYAEFAGSVLPSDVDVVLFTEPGQELEGKNRLARIGFDRVIGYLDRPFDVMLEHRDDVQVASRLTAKAFDQRASELPDLQVVDVRNPGEVAAGTIPNAVTIPVGQLPSRSTELDPAKPTVVYCAGGYRSSVAASLLGRTASPTSATSWGASAPGTTLARTPETQTPETQRKKNTMTTANITSSSSAVVSRFHQWTLSRCVGGPRRRP